MWGTKKLGIIFIILCMYNLNAGPLGGFLRNRKVLSTKKKTRTTPIIPDLISEIAPTPAPAPCVSSKLATQQAQEPPIPMAKTTIQEHDALKTQLMHEQEQVQLLKKEKTEMMDQIAQLQCNLEDLQLQLDNQKQQFYRIQHQSCEIAEEREALRKERDGLLAKQQDLLVEQQEMKGNMVQLQQLRTDIEQEIKQQYAQQLAEAQQKITTTEKKIARTNEKHQKIIDRTILKEQDLAAKNKQIAILTEQIAKQTERIAHLEYQVCLTMDSLTNEKNYKIGYREELKKLAQENRQLRLEKDEIIKTTKAEIQTLKHELINADVEQEITQKIAELGQKKAVTVSQNKP
jgi:chromosome segregation ATPase